MYGSQWLPLFPDNAVQRDYSASWLGLLLVGHYEVDSAKPSSIAIVTSEYNYLAG